MKAAISSKKSVNHILGVYYVS